MALPSELQRLLDEAEQADRRGLEIASACTDTQFFWRPRDGEGWSIAQCLDHLGKMNAVYSFAIRSGIEAARARGSRRTTPAEPGYFGGKFVRSLEPPVRRRIRAPRQGAPTSREDRSAILERYRAGHDRVRQVIVAAAEIDANRAVFRNPFLPLIRFSIATGLFVIAAHDRRHLWQAEQVRQTRGFPANGALIKG